MIRKYVQEFGGCVPRNVLSFLRSVKSVNNLGLIKKYRNSVMWDMNSFLMEIEKVL